MSTESTQSHSTSRRFNFPSQPVCHSSHATFPPFCTRLENNRVLQSARSHTHTHTLNAFSTAKAPYIKRCAHAKTSAAARGGSAVLASYAPRNELHRFNTALHQRTATSQLRCLSRFSTLPHQILSGFQQTCCLSTCVAAGWFSLLEVSPGCFLGPSRVLLGQFLDLWFVRLWLRKAVWCAGREVQERGGG